MRRYIAFSALCVVTGASLVLTASCGSQPATSSARGDGGGGGDGAGGDSTTGGGSRYGEGGQADNAASAADSSGDDGSGSGGDDGSDADDGGLDGPGSGDSACVPATGCPATFHCGRYVDPCTGNAFACGSPCTGGQVCVSGGGSSLVCQPKSCVNRCGVVAIDGCGVAVNCGGCTGGQVCINNSCVAEPTGEAGQGYCEPLTCTPSAGTHLCGTVADVCGNSTSCSCPSGQQCIDGVCSPPPPECGNPDAGYLCGSVPNACGSGSVSCSSCPSGTHCTGGTCTSCPAPSCGSAVCGTATNACGESMSCGTCATGQECTGGSCCTPSTCDDLIEAGAVTGCAPVSLNCGISRACSFCDGGEVCSSNVCAPCVPKTCKDYGDAGCGHSAGCGSTQTLDCCASGTTCMGTICCPPGMTNANGICCPAGKNNENGICCPPGQVNYGGSCCKPTCNPQLAGAQVSCGVTLYCGG